MKSVVIKQVYLKSFAISFLFLSFLFILFLFEGKSKNENVIFKRKLTSIREPIASLGISSSTSHISWGVYVEDEEILESFQNEIDDSGLLDPSGHSGPVGEWLVNIKFQSGLEYLYLASVHKYERSDLFIYEGVFKESGDYGSFNKTGRCIRLHGWGSWIIKEAPEGLFLGRTGGSMSEKGDSPQNTDF